MLAWKGLIIFLVGGNRLNVKRISLVINDFLEDYIERGRMLAIMDLREIEAINGDSAYFTESYLFKKLVNYALPFFERAKRQVF